MENKFEIKFPSQAIVTVSSIWRCLNTIAKTGKVFNKSQLIQQGLSIKSEESVGRILNYIKYLGIVEESRSKEQEQKFTFVQNKTLNDMLYEMKANREEEAKRKFKEYLQTAPLFVLFSSQFFKGEPLKTFSELEYFLKDNTTGKDSETLQKGGKFLMELFNFFDLVTIKGNDITVKANSIEGNSSKEPNEESDEKGGMGVVTVTSQKTQSNSNPYTHYEDAPLNTIRYNVRIMTPNSNHALELINAKDVDIAIYLLEKVKVELENGL